MRWRSIAKDLRGPFWHQFSLPPEIQHAHRVAESLEEIERQWPTYAQNDEYPDVSPVFILSAGWGAGSTLLQRLVMSSGEVLVWGEPLDQAAIIQRLSMMVSCVRSGWPPAYHYLDGRRVADLSGQWIANMSPSISSLRSAHRSMLRKWLEVPEGGDGVERWGVKEVRLTIDHARYLRWLFPCAKFIFIYRDLYDSYKSCKGVDWYSVWPGYRVRYPVAFARHWKLLTRGFIDGYKDLDAMLVRYEDLISGKLDLGDIARYVGVGTLDATVLEKIVGSRAKSRDPLSLAEKAVLKSIAGRLRKELGYGL